VYEYRYVQTGIRRSLRRICRDDCQCLLTRLSPDEWRAVGVLAGILVALFTLGINWYYKRKATLAQIKALQRWPTAPDINED